MRKKFWFTLMVFQHMVLMTYGIGAHNNSCKRSPKPCVRNPKIFYVNKIFKIRKYIFLIYKKSTFIFYYWY